MNPFFPNAGAVKPAGKLAGGLRVLRRLFSFGLHRAAHAGARTAHGSHPTTRARSRTTLAVTAFFVDRDGTLAPVAMDLPGDTALSDLMTAARTEAALYRDTTGARLARVSLNPDLRIN